MAKMTLEEACEMARSMCLPPERAKDRLMMDLVHRVEVMDTILEEIALRTRLLDVSSPAYSDLRDIYNLAQIGRDKWNSISNPSDLSFYSSPPSVVTES